MKFFVRDRQAYGKILSVGDGLRSRYCLRHMTVKVGLMWRDISTLISQPLPFISLNVSFVNDGPIEDLSIPSDRFITFWLHVVETAETWWK